MHDDDEDDAMNVADTPDQASGNLVFYSGSDDPRTFVMLGGHLDGIKLDLPHRSFAYFAFLGFRWSVYRRVKGALDRMAHVGYAGTREDAEKLIRE
jgi:hypothetical protein